MHFFPARRSAASVAALIATAAAVYVVDARAAAPPPRKSAAPAVHAAPAPRPVAAPRVTTPRPTPQAHTTSVKTSTKKSDRVVPQATQNTQNTQNTQTQGSKKGKGKNQTLPSNPTPAQNTPSPSPVQAINPGQLQKGGKNVVPQKGIANLPQQGNQLNQLKLGPGKPVVPVGGLKVGPGGLQQIKPAFPVINVNNKFFPIFKGQHFIWMGGFKKFFVPIGVLGVVFIGGSYWYPDGYVSIAGPTCGGFTPDGCQLRWRMVDFVDGGAEPQCVQYCPRVGLPPPPPAQIATLPPPPPLPANGTCQVTIFSDPNFGGLSAPTGDAQPSLSQTGWLNEIASVQVQAGTWDFFTDENYGGDSMRLQAGPYPLLAPEWTKKIGSFMCVRPGAPGA
jgi:beta/gamma crystallin